MDLPYPLLQLNDPRGVEAFLRSVGWVQPHETVLAVEKPGEGNMNLVLRIRTDARSVILKQSRPWVEKYPSIPAPGDRILVEMAFYRAVATVPAVRDGMPRLLADSPGDRCALLEDLGTVSDFSSLYADPVIQDSELTWLADWLGQLHAASFETQDSSLLTNREMRQLNHAHIFRIPLGEPAAIDLDAITPGLARAASTLRRDRRFGARAAELGSVYLDDGKHLLHGDYYPGSWVRAVDGSRVIDPEFCFWGPREFDLGVFMAHLILAGVADERWEIVTAAYESSVGLDSRLLEGFAGIEIMRRLIGVAQLPLERSLTEKAALLDRARTLVLGA